MSITTTTVVFDDRLADNLPFGLGKSPVLKKWILESNPQNRSKLAVEAFSDLLERACKRQRFLSNEGLSKIPIIANNILRFEGLIEQVYTKFRKKIYRDHLNHMLRTSLIASLLARNIARASPPKERRFRSNDVLELVVASLFHDIGYPVEKAGEIFSNVADAIGEGYTLISFTVPQRPTSEASLKCLHELENQTQISQANLHHRVFHEPEHATIGAFEFLYCCTECQERSLRIAAAILLHSLKSNMEVSYENNPLAVLLTIADELQDWGRPTAHPDGSYRIPLQKLEVWERNPRFKFRRPSNDPDVNVFRFEYGGSDFPTLTVIHSKYANLRRLIIDRLPLDIEFRFPLTNLIRLGNLQRFAVSGGITKIRRRFREPWALFGTHFSDRQISDWTGLSPSIVQRAREALMRNEVRLIDDPYFKQWNIWRNGNSGDFLVTRGMPTELDIISESIQDQSEDQSRRFIMRISVNEPRISRTEDVSSLRSSYSGELIFLNDHKNETDIPLALRPLPVTLASFNINNQDIATNVYWFKESVSLPAPISLSELSQPF